MECEEYSLVGGLSLLFKIAALMKMASATNLRAMVNARVLYLGCVEELEHWLSWFPQRNCNGG